MRPSNMCVCDRERQRGGADIGTQTGRGRDGGVMETWIYVYMYVHFPGINTRPLRETWFMLFYRLDLINFYTHVTTKKKEKKRDTKKLVCILIMLKTTRFMICQFDLLMKCFLHNFNHFVNWVYTCCSCL